MNSNILTGCFVIISVCITLLTVVFTILGVAHMTQDFINYIL